MTACAETRAHSTNAFVGSCTAHDPHTTTTLAFSSKERVENGYSVKRNLRNPLNPAFMDQCKSQLAKSTAHISGALSPNLEPIECTEHFVDPEEDQREIKLLRAQVSHYAAEKYLAVASSATADFRTDLTYQAMLKDPRSTSRGHPTLRLLLDDGTFCRGTEPYSLASATNSLLSHEHAEAQKNQHRTHMSTIGVLNMEDKSTSEVQLQSQVYWWHDKYRPRKPKYITRVHTGYEWNKYNQTHYDSDNPPPKVVIGYKFSIFYPDLIDKTKSPQYFIKRTQTVKTEVLVFFGFMQAHLMKTLHLKL